VAAAAAAAAVAADVVEVGWGWAARPSQTGVFDSRLLRCHQKLPLLAPPPLLLLQMQPLCLLWKRDGSLYVVVRARKWWMCGTTTCSAVTSTHTATTRTCMRTKQRNERAC